VSESPVWQVDAWELESDLAKIGTQWDHLAEILERPELYDLRDPAISGWSCGEHAGHVVMVARWVAAGIRQNLAEPERDADGAWTEPTKAILEEGHFPRGAAKSPPRVDPAGRSREEFPPVLSAAREAWAAVESKADELPACQARFRHFALGYLTSTEWVRFCAVHTAHHLAVVRDLRQASA